MRKITKTEQEILDFMRSYFLENDQLPSCAAICKRFGYSSDNAAHQALMSLMRKGQIERNACGKFRFTRTQGGSQPVCAA
jgi:SOS-response transcriptional repressor LexA